MRTMQLKGDDYSMGRAIGENFEKEITYFCENRYTLIKNEFATVNVKFNRKDFYKFSKDIIAKTESLFHDEFQEIKAISDVCKVKLDDLFFAIGYSDMFDLMSVHYNVDPVVYSNDFDLRNECSAFYIKRNNISFMGQSWDMPPKTNKFSIVFERDYLNGLKVYSYSVLLGQTYMGMNSYGISIGTTNVATILTQNGILFPFIIHKAIKQRNISDTVCVIKDSYKASGHYYYLANSAGEFYGIETDAKNACELAIEKDILIHTNHYCSEKFELSKIQYSKSSQERFQNLYDALLNAEKINIEQIKKIYSNHKLNLCRHTVSNEKLFSETGGAVFFQPEQKSMIVSLDKPCLNNWKTLKF